MPKLHCPICDKPVDPGSETAPFCSERCRNLDLGRWLDERYSLPYESEDDSTPEGWDRETDS